MEGAIKIINAFRQEEDGVAIAEYLVLLGILLSGLILAVIASGTSMAAVWVTWGGFWGNLSP